MTLRDFSGFPFPALQSGPKGPLLFTEQNTRELVQASLVQIILTPVGSRPWNPEFGCDIHRFLFETANGSDLETMTNLVYLAVKRWEPRVSLSPSDITIAPSVVEAGSLEIQIEYTIQTPTLNTQDSLTLLL